MTRRLVIYPIDTVKSRMQQGGSGGGAGAMTETMRDLWVERGCSVRGLYRGVVPVLVRAFPIHAVSLMVYDAVGRSELFGGSYTPNGSRSLGDLILNTS